MTDKMKDLVLKQINMELYSAYLYLDMANYYADQELNGFANWYEVQTQEERDHAMMFRTYLINNSIRVTFDKIDAPVIKYAKPIEPLKEALKHEKIITAAIYNMYDVANKEKDFRIIQLLNWFVKEQGEEETNATTNISKYEVFATDAKGLYLLDQEMGTRIYTPNTYVVD